MKKTKYGDYEKVVCFPVWQNYNVHIVFTNDIGDSRTPRYGSQGKAEGSLALHSNSIDGNSHIFFRLGNAPMGVIAHECWHAIRCMMVEWGGVEIMENEVTAYHLGYLVQAVSDFKLALIDSDAYDENFLDVKSSMKKVNDDQVEITRGTSIGLQSLRNPEAKETLVERQGSEEGVSGTKR